MSNWLKALTCLLRGHKIEVGTACPVTGIKRMTCTHCGADNMPKHDNGMNFN